MKPSTASTSVSGDSLFQNVFDHAAVGMALIAPDGTWLKVNRAICQITGYSEAELLRCTFQDITHPDDLESDLANVQRMLAGEITTFQMEKRYLHKNGSIVWVLLSVSLVRDAQGQARYFISQIQDITAAKDSEDQLNKAAAEIKKLQRSQLKVCSWTKRIYVDGRWISVDEFLRDRLRLTLTHGMSVEGGRIFKGN